MTINGNQATITFTHAAGLTTDDGLSPEEFQLAGIQPGLSRRNKR